MGIAFDKYTNGGFANPVGAGGTTSWTHTPVGSSNLFVMVALQVQGSAGALNISGVTYGGVALTRLFDILNNDRVDYWYGVGLSTGAQTVAVTVVNSCYVDCTSTTYTGVAQSSPIDDSKSATNSSNAAISTSGLTVNVANDWRIGIYFMQGTSTAPTTTDTLRGTATAGSVLIYDSAADLATGTRDITYTPNSSSVRNTLAFATVKASSTAYTLTAAQGSFTLTGEDTAFHIALNLTAAQGSLSLTGQTTNFSYGRSVALAFGPFALTGSAANFNISLNLTAAQGSFSLTGENVTLAYGRVLTTTVGLFSLTGQIARLLLNGIEGKWTFNQLKHLVSFTNTAKNTSSWTKQSKS